MRNVRRYFQPGDTVFVTCVTKDRVPILTESAHLFPETLKYTSKALDCRFEAWVLLPDHVHFILSSDNEDPSRIVKRVKEKFARLYLASRGLKGGNVWQFRFWDRVIRDEAEWRRHVDYIHYNPVKHGYMQDPFKWQYSSLGEFFARGQYERNWRVKDDADFEGDYGE